MKPNVFRFLFVCLFFQVNATVKSQNIPETVAGIPVNYDEALTGTYELPDPLILQNGERVTDATNWMKRRRPEIVELFREHQFGKTPDREELTYKVFETGTPAFNGKAIRSQVTLYFTKDTASHKADLLIYLPAGMQKPAPLFLNISFMPNILTVDDPGVRRGMMWNREGKRVPAVRTRPGRGLDV
ncbi:MAG: hypothetical protein AB7D05_09570, partial [Mangrovibacterium sp.]